MIDTTTYQESIANMDVHLLQIESLIRRMEKCIALTNNRNMNALIKSLQDKRRALLGKRSRTAIKLFDHYQRRGFSPTELQLITGHKSVNATKKKREVTRREYVWGY